MTVAKEEAIHIAETLLLLVCKCLLGVHILSNDTVISTLRAQTVPDLISEQFSLLNFLKICLRECMRRTASHQQTISPATHGLETKVVPCCNGTIFSASAGSLYAVVVICSCCSSTSTTTDNTAPAAATSSAASPPAPLSTINNATATSQPTSAQTPAAPPRQSFIQLRQGMQQELVQETQRQVPTPDKSRTQIGPSSR